MRLEFQCNTLSTSRLNHESTHPQAQPQVVPISTAMLATLLANQAPQGPQITHPAMMGQHARLDQPQTVPINTSMLTALMMNQVPQAQKAPQVPQAPQALHPAMVGQPFGMATDCCRPTHSPYTADQVQLLQKHAATVSAFSAYQRPQIATPNASTLQSAPTKQTARASAGAEDARPIRPGKY